MEAKVKMMWDNLSPLPLNWEGRFKKFGIRTGSRVIGGFNENTSDIDILFYCKNPKDMFVELLRDGLLCYSCGDYDENEYVSGYVKMAGNPTPVNIIFIKDREVFADWVGATKALHLMRNIDSMAPALHYKKTRVMLFETMKEITRELREIKGGK